MVERRGGSDTHSSAMAAVLAVASRQRAGRRRSLHEEVVNDLRDMVLDGRLAPGSRLPEAKLCEVLNISRTPLREAFKVLAKEGLVRLLPHRGAVVTDITVDEVADLFAVMASLEQLVGQLAASNATDEEIEEIRGIHRRMVQRYQRRRRKEYFRLNQLVHRRLAELTRNTVLRDIHAALSDKVRRARALANTSVVRWQESVQEHDTIVKALAARDAERLGAELSEHLRRTGEIVIKALRVQDAAGQSDAET